MQYPVPDLELDSKKWLDIPASRNWIYGTSIKQGGYPLGKPGKVKESDWLVNFSSYEHFQLN